MSNRVYSTRADAIKAEVVEPIAMCPPFDLSEDQIEAIAAECIVSEMRNGSLRYWCELDATEFWELVERVVEGA